MKKMMVVMIDGSGFVSCTMNLCFLSPKKGYLYLVVHQRSSSAAFISQTGLRRFVNTIVDPVSKEVAVSCATSLLPVLRTRPAWLGSCFVAAGCATPLLELSISSTLLDGAAEYALALPATAVATRAFLAARCEPSLPVGGGLDARS